MLKWRRDRPVQAEKLWDALGAANADIFDCLEDMNSQYRVRYVRLHCVAHCAHYYWK